MPDVNTHIAGLRELAAALRELPALVGGNVLRGAVAGGAQVVRKEAVTRAPEYHGDVTKGHPPPGTLKRAIYIKWMRSESDPARQVWIVGVRSGKKWQSVGKKQRNLDAYYWSFVEFGTSKSAAHQFMRPALASTQDQAIKVIQERLMQRIDEAAAKLAYHP